MTRSVGAFLVRDLHVWASDIDVIRHVRGKLKPTRRKRKAFRAKRKLYYQQALVAHRENRALYDQVVAGQFRYQGKKV